MTYEEALAALELLGMEGSWLPDSATDKYIGVAVGVAGGWPWRDHSRAMVYFRKQEEPCNGFWDDVVAAAVDLRRRCPAGESQL